MKSSAWLLGLFGLLAVTALPTSSAHAQATRTWVSGVGDDVNPCSRTAPCKTFAGAISKTAAGGEINCLDPGGYGTLTITKSITIDCAGTLGSTLNSGAINGFVLNDSATATPNTINVVLRNLAINGAGTTLGLNGINFVSGRSLRVENVTIENQSNAGINVNKTTFGTLTVNNVFFDKMPVGIKLTTTTGNIVASISDSKFNAMTNNGVEANANVFAGVSNSVFAAIGGTAMLAATATSTVYAKNNMIQNSNVGISAFVSGAKINASGNGIYGGSKAFNVAGGATFRSASNNEVDQNPGDASNGALALR
jgi:hypothetical protein